MILEKNRTDFPGDMRDLAQHYRPSFDPKKFNQMQQDFEEDGMKLTEMWQNVIKAQKEHTRKAVNWARTILLPPEAGLK